MNIGIDIDDTILNTIEATDYYAKEYTENTLKRNFIINKVENYGPMWFLDVYRWTLEEDQVFFKLYKNKIFGNAKPKEYVKEVLDKIAQNNKIIIITARENELKEITINCLKTNNICFDEIIFEQKDKVKSVINNNIDLFIDDNADICKAINGIGIKTLIMDSRINKKKEIEGVERVYSWRDIEKVIENL